MIKQLTKYTVRKKYIYILVTSPTPKRKVIDVNDNIISIEYILYSMHELWLFSEKVWPVRQNFQHL